MPLMDMQTTLVTCPMCFTEVGVRVTRNRETRLGTTVIERELSNLSAVRCTMCCADLYVTVRVQPSRGGRSPRMGDARYGNAAGAKRLSH